MAKETTASPQTIDAIALTFDVDWAPSFAIQNVVDVLRKERVKATMFATHPDPILEDVGDNIEIGIHPFFQRTDKTHLEEKIEDLRGQFPHARGQRSHGLFSSTQLTTVLGEKGFAYESNVLSYKTSHLSISKAWNGVYQIPIYWEDDVHMMYGDPWQLDPNALEKPGLKVFNFHPLLTYLNAKDLEGYTKLKSKKSTITELTKKECEPFINKGWGVQSVVEELLDYIQSSAIATRTLTEIVAKT